MYFDVRRSNSYLLNFSKINSYLGTHRFFYQEEKVPNFTSHDVKDLLQLILCILNTRKRNIEFYIGGSSGRVCWGRGGRGRNIKCMRLPLAAIFFMTYFYRAGGHGQLDPRPATDSPCIPKTNFLKVQSI